MAFFGTPSRRRSARSTFPRRRERSKLSLRNSILFSFYFLFLLRSLPVYSRFLRRFPTTLVRVIEVGLNESTICALFESITSTATPRHRFKLNCILFQMFLKMGRKLQNGKKKNGYFKSFQL